jgi:HAMP domain-containing protein
MKTLLLSMLLSISPFLIATATAQEENASPTSPSSPQSEETIAPKAHSPAIQQIIEEHAEAQRKIIETEQAATAQAAALEADGQPGPAAEVRQRAREKMQATVEELHRSTEGKIKQSHKEGACPVCQQNEADNAPAPPARDNKAEQGHRRQADDRQAHDRQANDRQADGNAPRPGVKRRLHHVEESIRHLRAAGLHDRAQELEKFAHTLRTSTAPSPRPKHAKPPHPQDDIQALRREIEALRQSVQSLMDKENRHH